MHILRLLALLLALGAGAPAVLSAQPGKGEPEQMTISQADREQLLRVARASIRAQLRGEALPPLETASPLLKEDRGAFVTLHRQGRLRGCIGYLEAIKPLGQTVQENALSAAFRDPRFPPLRPEELADLEIEISVLSPMRLITKVEEIEVGKHGLYLVRGWSRGVLLPQVATEQGWDRPTFLEQTCHKAGLPKDAWQEAATLIYVFTSEVFSDHPRPGGSSPQERKVP